MPRDWLADRNDLVGCRRWKPQRFELSRTGFDADRGWWSHRRSRERSRFSADVLLFDSAGRSPSHSCRRAFLKSAEVVDDASSSCMRVAPDMAGDQLGLCVAPSTEAP